MRACHAPPLRGTSSKKFIVSCSNEFGAIAGSARRGRDVDRCTNLQGF